MPPPSRILLIGNALPRRCGIATFTMDLQAALSAGPDHPQTGVVAMTDDGMAYDYPASVLAEIPQESLADYARTAAMINSQGWDVVCLQHEFGIFGGVAGSHILGLLSRLTAPVVTTLHTVLESPSPEQSATLKAVIAYSARVVVMAEKARTLLGLVYGTPDEKIHVIPHGIPDVPFCGPEAAKAKLGYSGRTVILTFGLLSPGKGVEGMIDAMPAILREAPDAVYVVLGATHPNLVRQEGEAYRQRLQQRVEDRGLSQHVVFEDGFVSQPRLLDHIAMCDIYVTPYLNAAQMTSGTLAYSFGMGRVVVSTPYWHAQELLADGRGILTAFGDSDALGQQISALLHDPERRSRMGQDAYRYSRSMTWAQTALAYRAVFSQACALPSSRPRLIPLDTRPTRNPDPSPMAPLTALLGMSDDTGLFQHAVHAVPDRRHGYCIDDNARALLLACALEDAGETPLPDRQTDVYAAFVQDGWNHDHQRFRNFMSFERRWLEPQGSEDSHGRTVWALGVCSAVSASPPRRSWAAHLLRATAPAVARFTSPRAHAFTLLGLNAFCESHPHHHGIEALRTDLALRLEDQLQTFATPDWPWFEPGLAYDNARLCEALITTGRSTGSKPMVDRGLETLSWLVGMQRAEGGVFRPVGSDTFGRVGCTLPFDQQPLEAAATIAACRTAWLADGRAVWVDEARRAFDWFHGANDLGLSLIDEGTGSCRDGLHPDRRNENRGGESVVSYLLAATDMRRLQRDAAAAADRRRTLAEIA